MMNFYSLTEKKYHIKKSFATRRSYQKIMNVCNNIKTTGVNNVLVCIFFIVAIINNENVLQF